MIAWEEREKLNLQSSADAVVLWALLEPLADKLYLPFALRGPQTDTKAPEETAKLWAESAVFFEALGLDVQPELAVLRAGKGWSKLRAAEQHAAKQRLMDAIARQITPETAARYRAFCVSGLITQYYKKAKADGRAKRTQVVTKALERTLSAFFGGDWLAFLDYLGEAPHAEEQIVTQLPKARLYVGTSSRAAEIAEQQGLPVEEVDGQSAISTPTFERAGIRHCARRTRLTISCCTTRGKLQQQSRPQSWQRAPSTIGSPATSTYSMARSARNPLFSRCHDVAFRPTENSSSAGSFRDSVGAPSDHSLSIAMRPAITLTISRCESSGRLPG